MTFYDFFSKKIFKRAFFAVLGLSKVLIDDLDLLRRELFRVAVIALILECHEKASGFFDVFHQLISHCSQIRRYRLVPILQSKFFLSHNTISFFQQQLSQLLVSVYGMFTSLRSDLHICSDWRSSYRPQLWRR